MDRRKALETPDEREARSLKSREYHRNRREELGEELKEKAKEARKRRLAAETPKERKKRFRITSYNVCYTKLLRDI